MKRIKSFCFSVIFCLGIVFVMAACGIRQGFCEKLDKIAAIVNGDVITEEEVALFMKMTDMAEEAGLAVDNPAELRRQLLGRMVEDRLVLQEAKNMGLKPDEKLIEDRIKDVKKRAGSELAFDMALKQQGYSLLELREKFRNQLMIYLAVQRAVRSKIQVSPKEVTEYYMAHQDQFSVPETVVVDSLFVNDAQTLAQAEGLLSEGKDFNEVAKEYSQKSNLGSVARGQLKKDLEDVLFGLVPGERSAPISVEGGFYVFLLKEKLAPSKKGIADVKDRITVMLEESKTEKKLKEWLESLKDKAYISIRE
jgi:peptidyl-prolyl cis-trans isomerase SurA